MILKLGSPIYFGEFWQLKQAKLFTFELFSTIQPNFFIKIHPISHHATWHWRDATVGPTWPGVAKDVLGFYQIPYHMKADKNL